MSFLKEELRLFMAMWQNGGRPLMIANVIAIGSLAALSIVLALLLWEGDDSYHPLGNYNEPQEVLTDGPIYPGDSILVHGVKCNLTDEPVSFTGTRFLRKISDGETSIEVGGGVRVLEPRECLDTTFENRIPDTASPGTYRFEGIDRAVEGSKEQIVSWRTETFEVLEGIDGDESE